MKRQNNLMNINEQVELAQFESDCAMLVHRAREKVHQGVKVEEVGGKKKDERVEEVERTAEKGIGKLDEVQRENRKLRGKVDELKTLSMV